jgi:uncharacterized protein
MLVQIENAASARARMPSDWGPDFRLFDTEFGHHLFMVNGSRVYTVPEELIDALRMAQGQDASAEILQAYGLTAAPYIDDEVLCDPPVRAISLAIAQSCNLGCVYCYAQQGSFGGEARVMERAAALGAIDLLLGAAEAGDRVQVTYLGGEPLANRELLRESAEYAAMLAARKGVQVRFSITSNGTLLTEQDGEFFERHGFAVTISLDGSREMHDRLRPFKDGRGSYERTMDRVRPLLQRQRQMQVSARVTVTPQNLSLRKTLDDFISIGFHSVGFSPMLSSPGSAQEMSSADLQKMLREMLECGAEFEKRVGYGDRYPFLNMSNALREIHKGTHRPYPCGAGAGYLGVSADGGLYACHRFVGDEGGKMGDLNNGIDREKRNGWLAARHVHFQSPCRECWARYLCGGGCHHEVLHRGRPACDYIRGWLEYCLQAYIRLLEKRPEYFTS